jgi:hypothetical protein
VSAGAVAAVAVASTVLGGFNPVMLGAAVLSISLSWSPNLSARSTWGGWTGVIALILVLGFGAQAAAPETAFLFVWPALLATLVAAVVAFVDPGLTRPAALAPIAVAAVLGIGWLIGLGHPVFLGIGMDLPGVLVLLALVGLMFLRPFSPETSAQRPFLMAGLAVLALSAGVSGYARIAEPMPAAVEAPAGD